MKRQSVYLSHITAWAPGIVTESDWKNWTAGSKAIEPVKDAPKLEYTDPLFRRRLSQLSRMTIQVVHDELEKSRCKKDIKLIYISTRGEIEREFTINESIISENMILPAAFSLSVFNAPVALASLAFGLKGGYSVIFPSKGNFRDAFAGACAPVLSEEEQKVMLIYADELVPEAYGCLRPKENVPLAFAAILSAGKTDESVCISDISTIEKSTVEFLQRLIRPEA